MWFYHLVYFKGRLLGWLALHWFKIIIPPRDDTHRVWLGRDCGRLRPHRQDCCGRLHARRHHQWLRSLLILGLILNLLCLSRSFSLTAPDVTLYVHRGTVSLIYRFGECFSGSSYRSILLAWAERQFCHSVQPKAALLGNSHKTDIHTVFYKGRYQNFTKH